MNKLKLVIGLLVIGIVILGVFLIKLIPKNQDSNFQQANSQNRENPDDGLGADKTLKKLSNTNMYFTIENIFNNYVLYFQNINMDVKLELGRANTSEAEARNNLYKQSITAVKTLFDKQYIEYKNHDENQIKQYIDKYKNKSGNSDYNIEIQDIYEGYISPTISVYVVYSKINSTDFNFMIKIDNNNSRYSIFWEDYLKDNSYNYERTEKIAISESSIEENNYNYFMMVYANDTMIVNKYFDNLKQLLIYNPNQLYEILDKDYKEKKFQNSQNFINYLRRISNRFTNLEVTKYQYKDGIIKIIDNYDNYYTFKISELMKYTVLLDNYTIPDEENIEIYNKSTEKEKVYINIVKFLNMINNKDYESAYNLLDNSFKTNKYSTIDKFVEAINNNIFNFSTVESVSKYTESGNNKICVLNIKNGEIENSKTKKMTVIMRLKEGTDFVMSFSF